MGIDIEEHVYGEHRYPGKLILADVLTLHGSLFARADVIVASPPCQEYSYMAMPWKRAKAKAAAIRADTTGAELARLTQLFNACFRIQREASEAAGRHIPMVVENVRGAQPWVGKAQDHFGSFYLWGDVPALMPVTVGRLKLKGGDRNKGRASGEGHRWNQPEERLDGLKVPGFRFDGSGKSFQSASVEHAGVEGRKNTGGSWFNIAHNTTSGKGRNPDGRKVKKDGLGGYGGDFGWDDSPLRRGNSKSLGRKFVSAMIAKIPLVLSRHIAATFRPTSAQPTSFVKAVNESIAS